MAYDTFDTIYCPHLNISLKEDLWKWDRFLGLSSASEFL
jgi:hypothetical protein